MVKDTFSNFSDKYRKWFQTGAITVIIWVIMWGLLVNGRGTTYQYDCGNEQASSHADSSIMEAVGYKQDGQIFKVKDDVFYLEMRPSGEDTKTVCVIFAEPYQNDAQMKVYYSSNENAFSEVKTVCENVRKGATHVTFSIPQENVRNIRVCIPGEYRLNRISLSKTESVLTTVEKNHIRVIPFIVFDTIFSIIIGFFLSRAKKPSVQKWSWKNISTDVLKIFGMTVVLYTLMAIVSKQTIMLRGGICFNVYRLLFCLGFSIFVYHFWKMREEWKTSYEKVFLLVMLTAGVVTLIGTPQLSERSWDAAIHYQNAYSMASAFEDRYNNMDVGHLMVSYVQGEVQTIDEKYNDDFLRSPLVDNEFSITTLYSRLGYLPSAVGIFLAKGLGLPFVYVVFAGRLTNLLCYILIVYMAIKRLPRGKMLMVIIATFPTCILEATNYSYDPWLISFTLLGFAYLTSFVMKPGCEVNIRDGILMMLAFVIGIGPKPIYLPLLFLAFFVPKDKFRDKQDRRKYYITVVAAIALVCALFMIPMFASTGLAQTADIRGGGNIDPVAQLTFIIQNPMYYAKVLAQHMKWYLSISNLQNFMVLMGYLGTGKFYVIELTAVILAIVADGTDEERVSIPVLYRVLSVVAWFGMTAVISTIFYLVFTDVGSFGIGGCQLRYLLPMVFPLAVALRSQNIKLKMTRGLYNATVYFLVYFVLWYDILQLVVRPYIIG